MMRFQANMDAVADLIGTVDGISESVSDPDYIDGLVTAAHAKAADAFDMAAAATAGAGYLTHVYEYGVAGITRGPARFTDPTSPASRLYVHRLDGRGGTFNIDYFFRPAVAANPQPTVASTGVASKYLRKLSRRKYVFRQKAMVMETGMEVEIRPKRGNLLFVPFYGEEPRNPLNKRGFMMYPYAPKNQPIVNTPGRDTKGTFTAFWQTWWETSGDSMMSKDIQKNIDFDVSRSLANSAARAATEALEPVEVQALTVAERKAKAKTESDMRRTTAARRRRRKKR